MIKTEALFGTLFENSRSILLVTDEKFTVRYVSSSVETIFGVHAYSLLGRNAFDFVAEENRTAWRACIEESNGNKSSEIKLTSPTGKDLFFDITVTNHISNKEILGLVVIMYDITERKIKHKSLEQANHQLDHFIFKTIHDLRSPIHSALGLIDLTQNASPDELEAYIPLIKGKLLKLENFIDDVSNLYRNDKLAVASQPINFDELFQSEKEYLEHLPGCESMEFEYDFTGSSPLISDPLRLKTILTNILSNAIKYKDPAKPTQFVRISVNVTEFLCQIKIQDNGLGIDGDHVDKIFDIFFRSHAQIQGTGLGLYIVKDTIERLKGHIEVESRVGQGTIFTITIPNGADMTVNQD
jgi:PAS domain S-box-containing protein